MEEALVGNAADESQVKGAGKKELRRSERERFDLQHVLSSPEGRRFVWKTISGCGVYQTSFSLNPQEMAYLEGQRNVGLRLLDQVQQADDQALHVMMLEGKQKDKAHGKRNSGSGSDTSARDSDGDDAKYDDLDTGN